MYDLSRHSSKALITFIAVGIFLASTYFARPSDLATLAFFKYFRASSKQTPITTTTITSPHSPTIGINKMPRTPVYFFSHGGPNIMYDTTHPVYAQLQAQGHEITQKVKPKAIVVFSAHWQAERANVIEVNVSETEPLIYDFYGFPRHYYAEKFRHRGSAAVAGKVVDALSAAGIKSERVERGLDHGVWAVFKVAFNEETNPVGEIPVVQVSLFDDERDAAKHIRLGRAVERLREEGICIIVSGMAVHNLRDMWVARSRSGPLPYAVSFDAALKEAVETEPGSERDAKMVGLLKRPDARLAHPTFEHLLPIHVGVGAAGKDAGKQLWTLPEGSMSWAQYRFGEVEASA